MPLGNVSYDELVDGITARVVGQVPYLEGKVSFVAITDDTPLPEVQRGMAGMRELVKLYAPENAVTNEPQMNNQIEFTFSVRGIVLYRRMGTQANRARDPDGRDAGRIFKDVVKALVGERLGLLNRTGLEVGPGSMEMEGQLQAIRFTVIARSRESRS